MIGNLYLTRAATFLYKKRIDCNKINGKRIEEENDNEGYL